MSSAREWIVRARALVDAGRAALDAVRSRNKDAVMDVGEQITISCDGCHQKYWDDTNAIVE
jgi:cytochrome c556